MLPLLLRPIYFLLFKFIFFFLKSMASFFLLLFMSSAPPLSESVGPPLRFLFLEFHLFLFNTHFFAIQQQLLVND